MCGGNEKRTALAVLIFTTPLAPVLKLDNRDNNQAACRYHPEKDVHGVDSRCFQHDSLQKVGATHAARRSTALFCM